MAPSLTEIGIHLCEMKLGTEAKSGKYECDSDIKTELTMSHLFFRSLPDIEYFRVASSPRCNVV